jgi:DNA-binding MarR family transcriptional regulator
MVAKISSLEGHVGFWLRFVSNQVSHAFAAKLAKKGVTAAEWVVLRNLLDSDGMNPSEIAESIGMTRGAISKLADRLVAKALVARTAGEEDRRYQTLSLTRAGRTLVPQLAALADRNDAEFFGHLTVKERAAIVAAMREIIRRQNLKTVPTT